MQDWSAVAQAVVLGVVQGLTEFLPISSSAHLILVPHLFGWPDQGLQFDLALHAGTLAAVLIYFRTTLLAIATAWLRSLSPRRTDADAHNARLAWYLVLATIPVGLAGLILQPFIAGAGRDPRIIAATAIVFGVLLGWVDRVSRRARPFEALSLADSAVIGAAQTLALVPGVSRSGITITAGLARGLDRAAAAQFAFLLSVPAGILVTAKDAWDLTQSGLPGGDWVPMAVGTATAAVSGYLVIAWLLAFLRTRSLMGFAIYRVVLGVVLLLWVV